MSPRIRGACHFSESYRRHVLAPMPSTRYLRRVVGAVGLPWMFEATGFPTLTDGTDDSTSVVPYSAVSISAVAKPTECYVTLQYVGL